MEANEPGFILLIVKILIAKISYPFIQAVCAAWMNAYSQFKDLTCLYDKLKSTVTNEEWQEILKEVGDEPDKEDE